MKSKLLRANGVGLPVQLKEVVQASAKSCAYSEGFKTSRGNQRISFSACILTSVEKRIFILWGGRDQPGRIYDPEQWQIGTAYRLMDPSSLFAEACLPIYFFYY